MLLESKQGLAPSWCWRVCYAIPSKPSRTIHVLLVYDCAPEGYLVRCVCRRFRFAVLLHALLNSDARRFGAMIGTFTALYKLILNALPIMHFRWEGSRPPKLPTFTGEAADEAYSIYPRMMEKRKKHAPTVLLEDRALSASPTPLADVSLPLSAQSTPSPPHLSLATTASLATARRRGFEFQPWQAALAGSFAAAVAILLERPSNRTGVSQQMFVR